MPMPGRLTARSLPAARRVSALEGALSRRTVAEWRLDRGRGHFHTQGMIGTRSHAFAALAALAMLGQSAPASAAPAALEGIRAVAVGRSHACALTNAGGVKCWGSNADGQLGDGTHDRRLTPVDVVGLSQGYVAIDAGAAYTCALRSDGLVKCWGANAVGQLGDGSTTSRSVPVDVLNEVTAISLGTYHACAVDESRNIRCWGQNGAGELGFDPADVPYSPVPLGIAALRGNAVAIAAGGFHTCAVSVAGAAACWGYNVFGQLGDGTMTSRADPVTPIGLRNGVSSISTGQYHTCAHLTDGSARCWGGNLAGALGDGTTFESFEPIEPAGLGTVAMVAAGGFNTCAITTARGVKCWGLNTHGQVGDGSFVQRLVPTDAVLGEAASSIAVDGAQTCAVTSAGRLSCWGENLDGQLGSNATSRRLTPVQVMPASEASSVVTVGGSHSCAVTGLGAVRCWGYNRDGQVGDGSNESRLAPTDVAFDTRQVTVVAGAAHSCSLSAEGGVACWGRNPSGQLGDGTLIDRNVPTPVLGAGSGFVSLAAGDSHTCAVTPGRTVKCWGGNGGGQLGDGTFESRQAAVDVPGVADVAAITAGASHTCALTVQRALKCWGSNMFGQLGDGTFSSRSAAADVVGLPGSPIAVAAGHQHTCALIESGAVNCWGKNGAGQLGDGTIATRGLPVGVVGLPGPMAAISAGFVHTCALATSGQGWCWGENGWGQLGDNTRDSRLAPVTVLGLAGGAATIATGGLHTCARMSDAGVKCWGHNLYGQIGDGTAFGRPVPGFVLSSPLEPGSPILVVANAENGAAYLEFLPPEGDGGSPITAYTASCAPGPVVATGAASPIRVPGLQNGTRYSCAVTATNAVGTGPASDAATVAPLAPPAISVSPSAASFGGQSIRTTSFAREVHVSNAGEGLLSILGVVASGPFAVQHACANLGPAATCALTITFTPISAGLAEGTLTIEHDAPGAAMVVALSGHGQLSLTTHFYAAVLAREADADGYAFWESEAARLAALGVHSDELWFAMAAAFFASAEYAAQGASDAEFVTDLYNTFFNRAPEAAGLAFWLGQLASGLPREAALTSFMLSLEFADFTAAIFGTTPTAPDVELVMDFYRGLLGRLPDSAGFEHWLAQVRAARCQDMNALRSTANDISSLFLGSAEYAAKGRTHGQFVADLYNAFLRRGGDTEGVQYWIRQLEAGTLTPDQVRQVFAASAEFGGRLDAIAAMGCNP